MDNKGFNVGLAVIGLLLSGTLGYQWIEDWSFAEAFYMTFITVTTTGFQEVRPLSEEGRVFTIFLLTAGVATIAYVTNVILIELLSVDKAKLRRKKMLKKIKKLSEHTIICGFGRMGKIVCNELARAGVDFVVVDKILEHFEDVPDDYLWLHGDATNDELLIELGIKKANSLASMVDSDADSLFLTLAARSLNPNLDITARFSHESAALKLKRAGANQVIQPLLLSAQKVAHIVMKREHHMEQTKNNLQSQWPEMNFTQMLMEDYPQHWGKTVLEFERDNHLIIACQLEQNGKVYPRPLDNEKIGQNQTFLTIKQFDTSNLKVAA